MPIYYSMFHNLKLKKKETLCVDLWFLALHLQEQYQQLQIIAHHERKTNKQQPP